MIAVLIYYLPGVPYSGAWIKCDGWDFGFKRNLKCTFFVLRYAHFKSEAFASISSSCSVFRKSK